jgi:hypothetical protein
MNGFTFKKLRRVMLLAAVAAVCCLGCGDDDDEGGSGGGDGGTGTIVVKNSSGTRVSTIRITNVSDGGKLVASRTANLSNGSSATFSGVPATRINVRVDIAEGTSFNSRDKSLTLGKDKKVTLTRYARSLD